MDQIKACMAALREAAPAIDILENEPMSRHTTFAIGGPADLFVQPKTADELTAALHALRQCGVTPLLLGNGSNMLVSDAGVRGAVVCTTELDEVRVGEDGGMIRISSLHIKSLSRRLTKAKNRCPALSLRWKRSRRTEHGKK